MVVLPAALLCVMERPANAGALGDWATSAWRNTQKANTAKLVAPIKVAQQRLQEAMDMVMEGKFIPGLQLVRQSSLNCYAYDALPQDDSLETKASLVQQKLQISDPCTFRLIVKNITSLSNDHERDRGETLVAAVILSYQKLDGELEGAIQGSEQAGMAASKQLRSTMAAVNQLEQFVQGVLA